MKQPEPTIYCEKIVEFLFLYVLCLPFTLTSGSKNRFVRVAGILIFFVWFLSVAILWVFFTVPMLVAMIFERTWKEGLA
jgi:hypothetical protein